MNQEKYVKTQVTLIEIGKMAQGLDLISFLSDINNAEIIGPLQDPTLYRRAKDNLEAIKKLAETLQPFQKQFTAVYHTVLKSGIREHIKGEKKP